MEITDTTMSRTAAGGRDTVPAGLYGGSGRDVLNALLDHEKPHEVLWSLSCEDFYWVLKKVGEEDSLPLLALASEEQWQFLLDLELWEGDRLDHVKTFQWISRLQQADIMRVARWFFGEGQALVHMYLFRHLHVEVKIDEDSLHDLREGFITLDGVYYFRPLDRRQAPEFEALLRAMAAEDRLRYQSVLSGLSGLIPAETEEDMYRMRSVRLAEHGFLPREEALAVYSPLQPSAALREAREAHRAVEPDPEIFQEAALTPLMMAPAGGLFSEVAFSVKDPVLLDRMRLEFSGLCNLIMSADGLVPEDVGDLEKISRKAAGYVNVALEHLCGDNLSRAMLQVEDTALLTLFRIGFGLAVEVGRRAGRWAPDSWWAARGLSYEFWGELWGRCVEGIVRSKPVYPSGIGDDGEFRDFRSIHEIRHCASILDKVMALDGLLRRLSAACAPESRGSEVPEPTVQAVLITVWARGLLGLEPGFSPVPLEEARRVLRVLKGGDSGKARIPAGNRSEFIRFFLDVVPAEDSGTLDSLEEALSDVWEEFCGEYRAVGASDLDPRFSRLLVIEPSDGAEPE